MNFRPRNSKFFGPRRVSHWREILVVLAILVPGAVLLSYFGGGLSRGLAPLWRSSNTAARNLSAAVGSLRSKDSLIAESESLQQKLDSDEELIVSLRQIASSRDELLATFGRIAPETLPASVLVHPPKTPYDILLVDAGSEQGVAAGDQVYLPEGPGLGTVTDVFSTTAKVRLYSTAGERTDAVLERGQVPVTLVGRGGGNLEFTLPRGMAVETGDRIITADLSSRLLGVVGDIEAAPTDSEKTVYVGGPINLSTVRFVLIKK